VYACIARESEQTTSPTKALQFPDHKNSVDTMGTTSYSYQMGTADSGDGVGSRESHWNRVRGGIGKLWNMERTSWSVLALHGIRPIERKNMCLVGRVLVSIAEFDGFGTWQ
jgi:hypothetical protein